MTVRELIERLQTMPAELPVKIEVQSDYECGPVRTDVDYVEQVDANKATMGYPAESAHVRLT